MKKGLLLTVLALAGVAFLAAPLSSYAGGTITGKVTYAGKSEERNSSSQSFPIPSSARRIPTRNL